MGIESEGRQMNDVGIVYLLEKVVAELKEKIKELEKKVEYYQNALEKEKV